MQDDLDRYLANEVEITPSSGFLPSVMEAVEREAIAPPPFEFPWLRALPGFLAAMVALAVAVWNGIGSLNEPATIAAFDEQLRQLTILATGTGLQWVALAVAITIVSVTLPTGLVSVRKGVLA